MQSSHQRRKRKRSSPLENLIPDIDFVDIDDGEVIRAFNIYDNNQAVKIAMNTNFNTLFCADFLFSRAGATLTETAKFWSNSTMKGWLTEVFRSCFAVGFAAVSFIPHHTYGLEPTCIDITQTSIRFHKDFHSQTTYIFYKRGGAGDGPISIANHTTEELREPIPNIIVLEMDKPNYDGTLRSRMRNLELHMQFMGIMLESAVHAITGRAAPPIVTEKEKNPYDPNAVPSAFRNSGLGPSGQLRSLAAAGDEDDTPEEGKDRHQYYEDLRVLNSVGIQNVAESARSVRRFLHERLRETNQVYLESGRTYVQHKLPEVPTEMIAHQQFQMEQVFLVLGVPPGQIMSRTSTGGPKGGASSGNQNIHTTFRESQQQLKMLALRFMKQIYMFMHGPRRLREYAKTLKEGDEADPKKVEELLHFHVEIPGLPDEDSLFKLYLVGLLKWDKLIECCAARHGIAIDGFNKSSPLTIQEANGIKEVETAQPAKR
jgi:hypothetical protein